MADSADFKPKFIPKKLREKRKQEEEDKKKQEEQDHLKLLQKKNKLYQRGLQGDELQDRLNGKTTFNSLLLRQTF